MERFKATDRTRLGKLARLLLPFIVLLILATSARAQDRSINTPRCEIFAGYSYLVEDVDSGSFGQEFHGFGLSATGNFNRWAGVATEFSGAFRRGGRAELTYLVGPRLSYRRPKATAFAHLLLGASTATFRGGSDTDPALAAGGGVDFNVGRSTAIRVQADYLPIFGGGTLNSVRVMTGIVFKLGQR